MRLDGTRRAWRVSFDRPYPPPGLGELPFASFPVVREAADPWEAACALCPGRYSA